MLSRLEITLERSQNRCEPSRIISHQNCHLLLCSPLSPHSQSLPDASSQDAHTAYVRNCHKGLRGSLRVHFSLLLCSNSICHVLGLNAYIVRPFGHSSQIEQTQSDLLNFTLSLIVLGPKVYLKTLTDVKRLLMLDGYSSYHLYEFEYYYRENNIVIFYSFQIKSNFFVCFYTVFFTTFDTNRLPRYKL